MQGAICISAAFIICLHDPGSHTCIYVPSAPSELYIYYGYSRLLLLRKVCSAGSLFSLDHFNKFFRYYRLIWFYYDIYYAAISI